MRLVLGKASQDGARRHLVVASWRAPRRNRRRVAAKDCAFRRIDQFVVERTWRHALERIDGAVAPFIADLAPLTLSRLVRALRERIGACERDGQSWYVAFDELRDVLWQFWPAMPAGDKRRFLRLLRPWYDVHRFRAPPQNDAMVRDAERRGRVTFKAARIGNDVAGGDEPIRVALRERGAHDLRHQTFDAVINCTGQYCCDRHR